MIFKIRFNKYKVEKLKKKLRILINDILVASTKLPLILMEKYLIVIRILLFITIKIN